MSVRVIRILEYTYSDAKAAERDMAAWQTPATGVKRFNKNSVIRSATTYVETIEEPEDVEEM